MSGRWSGIIALLCVALMVDGIQSAPAGPGGEGVRACAGDGGGSSRSAAVLTPIIGAPDESLLAIDWNPSNDAALIVGGNGTVLEYNATTGFRSMQQDNNFTFQHVAFRPASSSSLGIITGFETPSGPTPGVNPSIVMIYDDTGFTRLDSSAYTAISGVAWSPDASFALMTAKKGLDGVILKYMAGTITEVYTDPPADYWSMCWGDKGAYVASYYWNFSDQSRNNLKIQLFDGTNMAGDVQVPSKLDCYPLSIAWSRTLQSGLCTSDSISAGRIIQFNSTQAANVTDASFQYYLRAIDWCHSRAIALLAGSDTTVYPNPDGVLFSYDGSAVNLESSGHYDALNDVAWHPSDRYALVVGDSGTVLKYTPANTRPLCIITAPRPGDVVAGDITVAGNASDPDGDKIISVQVRIDAGAWNNATGGENWTFDWDTTAVLNGQHTIYARSSDGIDDSISDARLVIVSNTNRPPTVDITSPTEGAVISGTVTVTGTASDPDAGQTVQYVLVSIDGGPWQSAAGTSSWTFNWNTSTVDDGPHTIMVRASDGELNSSDATRGITVQNKGPNSPPTCAITAPAAGATVTGQVLIEGNAADADNGVQAVFVRIDSGTWQQASGTTSWSFLWDTGPAAGGSHLISAHAFDGLVNSSEVHINIAVNHPPACTITSPAAGDAVSGVVTITGTASDPDSGQTITAVSVKIDGGDWAVATGTLSWSYKWDTAGAVAGTHTIHARSSDGSLDSAEATDTVTVRKLPTPVVLSDPASVGEKWVVLVWSRNADSDFARYEVYMSEQEGQPLSELSPRNIPTQSVTVYNYTGLQPRTTYWFRVVVKINSGLQAVSNEVFATTERENQPPVAMLTASTTRATVGSSITFSADGSYDPDRGGRVARFQWDFDGSGRFAIDSGLISSQRHEFGRAGKFTVSVLITDDRGATSTISVNVTIVEPQKSGLDPLLIGGLLVVFVIVGAAAYFLVRRAPPEEPTPEERIHEAAARRRRERWPDEGEPPRAKKRKQ